MKTLVTGANGHIGAHVTRTCMAAGMDTVAMVRPGSDQRGLRGLDVEIREGDLLDPASLRRAAAGAELVFHVGAPHRNWALDEGDIVRPAVEGTRNMLDAARAEGVRRVVYTSSGATVGFAEDPGAPLDESTFNPGARSAYIRAKIDAEKVALAAAARGDLEVVTVNPSGVFGPLDYRLTPATRAVAGLVQGDPAMFAVSVTDVRDVATGHLLAANAGRSGERYLLTGDLLRPGELSDVVGRVAGVRPRPMRPPRFLLNFVAGAAERKARKAGGDAPVTRDQVADVYGRHLAYDSRRARTELGATFRPADAVFRDAFRWLVFVGGLKPRAAARVRAALGDAAGPDPDWVK